METEFTIELYKDWNNTCKLYFETIIEADMWVNLLVIPVPYAIKHAIYSENFWLFDSFLFYPW